jgi:AAA+ superfamily predicted ATPase
MTATLAAAAQDAQSAQDVAHPASVGPVGFGAALLRLDLRLRLAVDAQRDEIAERARDPFRGLYISEADVDALLASVPSSKTAHDLLQYPAGQSAPRLQRLAGLFGLQPAEQDALLICLAPDLDLRYERLFGYLQDDVTRRRPTVDLLLRLLWPSPEERLAGRALLAPAGRLMRHGLLALSDETAAQWPLLARPLRVDERVADYLSGSDELDPRISSFAEVVTPGSEEDVVLPGEVRAGLERLLSADAAAGPIVYVHGAAGTGKLAAARAACALVERPMLHVGLPVLLAAARPERSLALAAREALLQHAVLVVDGFDRLLRDEPDVLPVQAALRRALAAHAAPVVLIGEARWEPATWLPDVTAVPVELPALAPGARLRVWRSHVDGQLTSEEAGELAERFRLDGGAIRHAAAAARGRAAWRGDGKVTAQDLRAAAQAIAAPPLEGMARRLEYRYGWEDLVLPPDGLAQLHELCARARHQVTVLERWGYGRKHARRAGITALFAGQPGTGKTMAAEIIAGDLGLDLYRIDLSGVVSKYIGETEKNLEKIFRAADQGDAVLLFDEADALFGKRSEVRDAHDRYANVEIAYLLQRLEAYDGLAVLTTNLRGNVDEAFLRRLDCVLEFPMPEEAERLAIWRRAVPPEAPLAADVDLLFLARKFKLSGGHIRNIALAGAFLAAAEGGPIAMKHLVRATRREYQKLGKLVAASDFERYYALLREG